MEDIEGTEIMARRTVLERTPGALDHYFHGRRLLNGPQSLTRRAIDDITNLPLIGTARRNTSIRSANRSASKEDPDEDITRRITRYMLYETSRKVINDF